MVQNSVFLQIALYFSVFVLCVPSVLSVYFAIRFLPTEYFSVAIPLILLAVVLGYGAYSGLIFVKFIPAKLDYNDEGITVTLGGKSESYLWTEFDKGKGRALGLIYEFSKEGKVVYKVFQATSGWRVFKVKAEEKIGVLSF